MYFLKHLLLRKGILETEKIYAYLWTCLLFVNFHYNVHFLVSTLITKITVQPANVIGYFKVNRWQSSVFTCNEDAYQFLRWLCLTNTNNVGSSPEQTCIEHSPSWLMLLKLICLQYPEGKSHCGLQGLQLQGSQLACNLEGPRFPARSSLSCFRPLKFTPGFSQRRAWKLCMCMPSGSIDLKNVSGKKTYE